MPDSKVTISRGLAWIGLASTLVGLLDLAAQVIILHFFISPEDYGVAALAVTLFPVLDQATDLGLSSAVIQRDDHSPEKIATVFWLNVIMSAVLFAGLAVGAPRYAAWQGYPVVGQMLLVYGGKLVFQNVYFIPAAMMRRELRMKELSIIRVIANVAEFAGKVGFAAAGWKIWCFVMGALMRVVITGIGVQLRHPWRPGLHFRPREAWAYARFGLSTSASQIVYSLYTNADYPVVSKLFGATALGLYRAAYELVLELVRTVALVFVEMGFPTFARLRHKRAQLVEQFLVFTRQSLVAIIPVVLVVFIAADAALAVAWGPEYAVASTAARILCLVGLLRAVSQVIPPLLDGIGLPGLTLVYHAVAALVLPALYVACGHLLGPSLGYVSVAVAWAIGYPVAFAVLAWLAFSRIGLSPLAYLRRVGGIPGCAVLAAPAGFVANWLGAGWPATPRLCFVAVATLAALFTLLSYLQGISPRAIARAISGKGEA
jgi:PST family polysaccharide transporter/lipopolysaccharide exporter